MIVSVKYRDAEGHFCEPPCASEEQLLLIGHAADRHGWLWFHDCLARYCLRQASETSNIGAQDQWIERAVKLREVPR